MKPLVGLALLIVLSIAGFLSGCRSPSGASGRVSSPEDQPSGSAGFPAKPAVPASTPPRPTSAGRQHNGSPVSNILKQRDRLRLSADQIARLKVIDDELAREVKGSDAAGDAARRSAASLARSSSDAQSLTAIRQKLAVTSSASERHRKAEERARQRAQAVLTPLQRTHVLPGN